MNRPTRIAAAAVLALAVGLLPIALEQCAESCEGHRDAAASAPSCHHAGSTSVRIGHRPGPCGHDHHPVVASAATTAKPAASNSFSSPVAVLVGDVVPATACVLSALRRGASSLDPRLASLPLALASALRI